MKIDLKVATGLYRAQQHKGKKMKDNRADCSRQLQGKEIR